MELFAYLYGEQGNPPRNFYYQLDKLLVFAQGKRLQKGIVLLPAQHASALYKLCAEYGLRLARVKEEL